jgi:hypothetical protein
LSIILKFGGTKNFLAVAIVFLLAYDSFSQCGNENPTIQNVSKTSDMSKGAEARTLSGPPRFGSNDVLFYSPSESPKGLFYVESQALMN